MKSFSALMSVFLISTFFVFPVAAEDNPLETTSKVLVVSSSQDRDIAKLIVESRDYDYHEIQWGKFTSNDADTIKSKMPDMLLIIGGPLAVPERAEKIGIESLRFGGTDRIETTRLVLKEFFNFNAKRSYILPSNAEVSSFLNNGQKTTAYLYIGNSKVSKRWGLYYKEKLNPFFKEICLKDVGSGSDACNAEKSSESEVHIGVGNTNNNAFVDSNWNITGLPEEVSTFPLIFLSEPNRANNGRESLALTGTQTDNQSAILFITGTDQNIFFTQRSMEDMHIVRHDLRGLSVFGIFTAMVIALIGLLWRKKVIESSYSIFLMLSFPALVYFYIITVLDTSRIHWDSLYVYFDGALSLYFLGGFESILDVRNLPGMSLLTYLFFKITGPTDVNAYYLQGIFFTLMMVSVSLASYRLYGRNAGILSFVLLASNPYLWDSRQLFSSDIPFVSLLSTLVFLLFFFNNQAITSKINRGTHTTGDDLNIQKKFPMPKKIKNYSFSGLVCILFCLLILLRHSGILFFLAILISTHLLKRGKIFESRPFIIAIICAFGINYLLTGNFASYTLTYFDEFKVRTGLDFSYAIYNFILAMKHSAILVNYIVAILVIYRISLHLAGDKIKNRINIYEGVLLTFSILHILAISIWPVGEWRYAIPIIPMLTIYVSGVTSERVVNSSISKLMIVLLVMGACLNIYHVAGGIRLI